MRQGVRALELGAGVGVSGIVLAELGASVTLTDYSPPILALLRRNVAQNAGGGLARRCSVAHLAWERPDALRMEPASLDLIVGSDVVYGGPKSGAPPSRRPARWGVASRVGRGWLGAWRVGGTCMAHAWHMQGTCTCMAAGALLLAAIGQLISLYGHPRTAVLLAFGCRGRGTDDYVGFLRAAAHKYEIAQLEPDEAVAEESGVDGVDIFELTPSSSWRP